MKTNWKRITEYVAFTLLVFTGLAIADLIYEGNTIEGVQVIAGKNSSTGKSAIPKVNSSGELLVVASSTSASGPERSMTINIGEKADTSATTDTGTFSLIALTKRIATHLTRVWQGPNASCAHIRGSGLTALAANSSGTSIDAGATGTGYWSSVLNANRTFAIDLTDDTGSTIIPPLGSFTWSIAGAATPDSATVKSNCAACSTGAASYVAITTCDDD